MKSISVEFRHPPVASFIAIRSCVAGDATKVAMAEATFLKGARPLRLIDAVKHKSPSLEAKNRGSTLKRVFLAALLAALAFGAKAGIPEPSLIWYGKVLTTSGGAPVRLTSGTLVWQLEPLAGGPAIQIATYLTNINEQFSFVMRVPCESPEPGMLASTNVVNLTTPASRYRRMTVLLNGQPLSLINSTNEISVNLTDRGRSERIDLRLGTAPVDLDSDGLADSWEMQHFGSLGANPADDPDGDGVNNLREFRAGTNPTEASSRFEVVEIARVPNGIALIWSSQPDRRYRVKRTSNLLTPPAQYDVVQSGLLATPPFNQFVDTTTTNGAQFFYLIEIQD